MMIGCQFTSFLLDHNEGVVFCGLTGLLFAGLRPSRCVAERLMPGAVERVLMLSYAKLSPVHP